MTSTHSGSKGTKAAVYEDKARELGKQVEDKACDTCTRKPMRITHMREKSPGKKVVLWVWTQRTPMGSYSVPREISQKTEVQTREGPEKRQKPRT